MEAVTYQSRYGIILLGEHSTYEYITVREKISSWKCFGLTEHGRVMTGFFIQAIVWALWKERNGRTFEGKTLTIQQLVAEVKRLVWDWYLDSDVKKKVAIEVVMFEWQTL